MKNKKLIIICACILVIAAVIAAAFIIKASKGDTVTASGENFSVSVSGVNTGTLIVKAEGALFEGLAVEIFNPDSPVIQEGEGSESSAKLFNISEIVQTSTSCSFCVKANETATASFSINLSRDGLNAGNISFRVNIDSNKKIMECSIEIEDESNTSAVKLGEYYPAVITANPGYGYMELSIETAESFWGITEESDIIEYSGPFDRYDDNGNHTSLVLYLTALGEGYAEMTFINYNEGKLLKLGLDCFKDNENGGLSVNIISSDVSDYIMEADVIEAEQ